MKVLKSLVQDPAEDFCGEERVVLRHRRTRGVHTSRHLPPQLQFHHPSPKIESAFPSRDDVRTKNLSALYDPDELVSTETAGQQQRPAAIKMMAKHRCRLCSPTSIQIPVFFHQARMGNAHVTHSGNGKNKTANGKDEVRSGADGIVAAATTVPHSSAFPPAKTAMASVADLTDLQKTLLQESWKRLEKDIAQVGIIVFINSAMGDAIKEPLLSDIFSDSSFRDLSFRNGTRRAGSNKALRRRPPTKSNRWP
ncbi:hypothetical protein DAPPUDRAFT_231988 [Daphnia pulex]|uniref:Globin family profile domain-containing protein n=1 Tax=Daphnia pulex TaxID=6669 RepID=E9FRN2_DAPPU|nr:hypothetical protein DAPPUDRAFT_231988 [Daphnia pulex]|eukprot:EFX89882.1 hypothetical protein DAPPUDRAFT_231988 [Daphnia pulex]